MIERINEYKAKLSELSKRQPVHTIEDFEGLIKFNGETLDKAIGLNYLFPYIAIAHNFLDTLNSVRESIYACSTDARKKHRENPSGGFFGIADLRLGISGSEFRLLIHEEEFPKLVNLLNVNIPYIMDRAISFDYMMDCLMRYIDVEVLPNELFDGERVYLGRGSVVIPSGNPVGYHVFSFSPAEVKGNDDLEFSLVNHNPSSSLEDAIRNHVDHTIVGSVAVARNTESYPLLETALPVVKEKYKQGLK